MKKLIPIRLAGNLLLAAFGLLAIFHVLVLLQVVPSTMVWGGQAGNKLMLESISLVVTLLFGAIIAARLGYLRVGKFIGVIKVLMWVIFAYLLLNLLGNLASSFSLETWIFTPLTLLMAFLTLRLAIER